ncbi:hypothetical protein TNIN_7271 [Trichonephila inaurata madagascariensis]|uniref:Uncharacterized protein n=1 Tax=Trichonephila inaurata madagascariensis TaxID=2747483 RepID=A0A8X6J373_9ARAC|nr:hypothetical protein TNIN_7271 [Trichonephila inaurata madagascariensis]
MAWAPRHKIFFGEGARQADSHPPGRPRFLRRKPPGGRKPSATRKPVQKGDRDCDPQQDMDVQKKGQQSPGEKGEEDSPPERAELSKNLSPQKNGGPNPARSPRSCCGRQNERAYQLWVRRSGSPSP